MLMMTEAAAELLSEILDNANAAEETAVRLVIADNALTPTLDHPQPGDETYDHDGRNVLVLDEQVSQVLTESTLDVQATAEGLQLVLLR